MAKVKATVDKVTNTLASYVYNIRTKISAEPGSTTKFFDIAQIGKTKLAYTLGVFVSILAKVFGDSALATDVASKQTTKNLLDTVNFTDDINGAAVDDNQNVTFFKGSQNTVNVQDSVQNLVQYFRSVSDSTTLDSSGVIIAQNYTVDNTYFAQNFVGQSATFT